ncbi:MAG TPA: serine hydrolase [Steroidobacteraceae bacterium]|nr:serine hydrolase [Steroidobacteraceae bacterium]
MARLVWICMAGVLLGSTASRAAAVDEKELHAQLVERIDVRKWGTAIVVGISSPSGRQIISYGTLALNDSRKVDGATVFEIASLTKVLTALVLADMAKQGQVKPQSPVTTCLPDGVKIPQHGGRQITFVDLATHSSGLPLRPANLASQTAPNKYAGYTVEQLYQGLAAFQLTRDPGTAFEYSNWAFGLLGNALAHCAGTNYESLLAARVTGPLGMRDTGYGPAGDARSRLAAPYDAKLQPMANEGLGALIGAGGLYSTVNDLLRFVDVFVGRGPQALTSAGATMLEPRRPGDGPDTQMGLGWRVTTSKGVRTMWSSGRADGYRAFMGFDPVARVAVVALTNAATNVGVDDIGWHILDPRLPLIQFHPRVPLSAEVLERYVGRYLFDDGVYMTVVREEDHLVAQMTGQGPVPMFASGPREFYPEDIEAQFVFTESGTAPAQSLVLNQDNKTYKAVRVVQEAPKK